MLPTEAFAEAVAFLGLFDLNALAVTNKLCSSLAIKASTSIRWEEFPGLRFVVYRDCISLIRYSDAREPISSNMDFPNENDMIEFVAAAFPNCIFEDVFISSFASKQGLEAIGRVAGSVIVKGVLRPPFIMSEEDSLTLVRKFRKVKSLQHNPIMDDAEAKKVANFFRGSGVQELRYHRSYSDSAPEKLTLF